MVLKYMNISTFVRGKILLKCSIIKLYLGHIFMIQVENVGPYSHDLVMTIGYPQIRPSLRGPIKTPPPHPTPRLLSHMNHLMPTVRPYANNRDVCVSSMLLILPRSRSVPCPFVSALGREKVLHATLFCCPKALKGRKFFQGIKTSRMRWKSGMMTMILPRYNVIVLFLLRTHVNSP